jgi:amino acid transporter
MSGTDPAPILHPGLRPGSVALGGVLMQGIAHTAPATAILLTLPFIASHAGLAAPLAYLIALLIMMMLGLCLTQLAKQMPSAGGYYTYVTRAVGPRAGFLTAWLFFLYAALTPAFSLAMMGWLLESALRTEYGITFPWWLFLVLGAAFTYWATYRRIEVSAAALTVLGLLEMGIVVLLAAWGLAAPGPGGLSLASFNPARAPSGNGLYLGIIFSLFAMTGWEGVVPLAEESKNPRHVVSRAIVCTILIMGAYLVFTSWGIVIGWGTDDLAALVASKELPPFALARRFWGTGWVVIMFALLNSMLAVAVACTLVSTRMWYAMARSGVLPSSLATIHARHKTPKNAVTIQALVTLLGGLGLGLWLGPDQVFYVMGTVLTLALALIYSTGNLGVFLLYRRRRGEFHPILHALLPALSSAAVLWVAYNSIVPLPPRPLAYAPAILASWFLSGVAILIISAGLGRDRWLLAAEAIGESGSDEFPMPQRNDGPGASGGGPSGESTPETRSRRT